MNGMEKIKAKIEEAARAEISALEADTKGQVDAIKAKGAASAAALKEDLLSRGKKEATEHGNRVTSSVQMECKKLELAMKQEVISQAFDAALQDLCNRSEKDYIDLLVKMALGSISSGNEKLVFSNKDKSSVGKQVVDKLNEAINAGKAPKVKNGGKVSVADETRELVAGFIMLDDSVEINCDFDTLVRLQRNELELEVARVLF